MNIPADVERALLGSVLIDQDRIHEVAHLVTAASFHLHTHRWAWDVMIDLLHSGKSIDALTVCDGLERRGQLADFGGMAYIAQLIGSAPTSVNAASYALSIADTYIRRRLMLAAGDIAKLSQSELAPDEVITEAGKLIGACSPSDGRGLVTAKQAVSEWYADFAEYQKHGKLPGLTTGYHKIDTKTNGLRRGEMLILAGRPGMGKTSLAAQMSIRQARAGLRVAVISLEEHYKTWMGIAVGAEVGTNLSRRDCDLTAITDRAGEIHNLPIAFNESGGRLLMGKIEWHIRRAANTLGGIDVIWLDHLGYINHGTKRGENTAYAIGQTTKHLISLAKEFNAALGVLCQLHREGAGEKSEPQLTDLRDSGEIEQDARQVWMLHTPGYYRATPPADDKPQESGLLVRKNSNGPIGKIGMMWIAATRRFAEVM